MPATCNMLPATQAQLAAYAALLLKWNAHINLVAASTEADLWERHIRDSAQLFPHLPADARTLTDFGSGGGLPGLVLAALCAAENRPTQLHLIESVGKKATFLQEAVRVMGLTNVTVHNARIEALTPWQSDVITARAFAPLPRLFASVAPFLAKEHLCLLLKGCKAEEEVAEASGAWMFDVSLESSITDPEGRLVLVRNLHKK